MTPHIKSERAEILACVPNRFTPKMRTTLEQILSKDELYSILKQMATGRSPGPDGVILEFFLPFWDVLSADYTTMLHDSILQGRLPAGMTFGVIALIR